MEPHAKYTLVGAMIVAVVGFAVFAVLWLSRAGGEGESRYFAAYFRDHSLAGLQVDSAVTMRGIRVGTVKSLSIASPDIELVKVILKLDTQTPVKQDTTVVVLRNLLTGLAYIDLVGSTADAPFLVKQRGEEYPVIPEGKAQFEAIAADVPKLIQQLNGAVQQASGFFSDENRASVTKILGNLEVLSSRFAASDADLGSLVADLSTISKSVHELIQSINDRAESLSRSLTNVLNVVSIETQSVSRSLTRASSSLATTLDRFHDPAAILAGPDERNFGPGEDTPRTAATGAATR